MRTYFFPSSDETYLVYTDTPSIPLKNKIDKFCQYSEWGTSLLEEGKDLELSDKLHGYIEDGKCYDNQYIFLNQSYEKYEKTKKQHNDVFDKFKSKLNKSIKILEDLFGKIKKYRDCKNYIERMQVILKKGYVLNTQNIGGSKRARRYKKNARHRYLTDHEIDNYKEKIQTEENNKITYKRQINSKKAIEDVFFTLGMTVKDMEQEAYKMNSKVKNYGDTIFLFQIFKEVLDKFDREIYKEVLRDYKEVLKIDEEEKVVNKKVTKNKTRVYIDEEGNEHVIQNDVEQIIRTL
jgi:hypothetical protein